MVCLHYYLLHISILSNNFSGNTRQEETLSVEDRNKCFQDLRGGKNQIKHDGKAPATQEKIKDWFVLGLRTSVIQKTSLVE